MLAIELGDSMIVPARWVVFPKLLNNLVLHHRESRYLCNQIQMSPVGVQPMLTSSASPNFRRKGEYYDRIALT